MIKEMLMRKMLKSQLKGMPEEEQEKMVKVIIKNPEFFQNLATKIQSKVGGGKDQQAATMEVMNENKDELQKILNQ